ncbi:MAG: SdrD B-like domain-containing protein [Caldilineaceae bacterium]
MMSCQIIFAIGRSVLFTLLTFVALTHATPAWASAAARPLAQLAVCNPASDVGGTVFRDYNANGVQDVGGLVQDGGVAAITATAYGADNQLLGSALTQADGSYAITGADLSSGARIEFSGLPAKLQPGAHGSQSGSLVQFVSGPGCEVDLGVHNPHDYCGNNPQLVTTCFIGGDPLGGGTAGNGDALVTWPYAENGWWFDYPGIHTGGAAPPTPLAFNSEMGSVWGIAYQRSTKTIFTAAMLKRHAGFGPSGPGGIYAVDISNPAALSVQRFITLTEQGIDVGPNLSRSLPANAGAQSHDAEALPLIGKMSLGGLDISEDDQTLYVMNLNSNNLNSNGELIALDLASKSVTAQAAIPDPGCLNNGAPAPQDSRPWAVKVHDGQVYVGAVCSAETSQLKSDLHAYIMRLNGNSFVPVFDFPLGPQYPQDLQTYPKGQVSENRPLAKERTGWFPWITKDFGKLVAKATNAPNKPEETLMYPQPILSAIEFDADGSMILGFSDRTGHMGGRRNFSPDANDTVVYNAHSGGDLLRVCNINGAFVLQNLGTCRVNATNNEGPGGGEFYPEDSYQSSGITHHETALGALALLPGSGEVVSTHFDAVRHVLDGKDDPEPRTGGVRFHSNTDGALNHWYEVSPDTDNRIGTFAKASGLGDLELLCDAAPIEIGNYVWSDDNGDGLQGAGEKPLKGVTVQLVDSSNQIIGQAQTDAVGQYYFSSAPEGTSTSAIYGIAALTPNTAGYQVRIALNQPALATMRPTLANANGDVSNDNKLDLHDSDGVSDGAYSAATFSTGAAGANNHNFDFGFVEVPFAVAIEKLTNGAPADGANDPDVPQIAPGEPVTWRYIVTNTGPLAIQQAPLPSLTIGRAK